MNHITSANSNLKNAYRTCTLCPRECGAHRTQGVAGVCGATDKLRIARAALHYWEEPPISGQKGSGAIFFSSCPLRCIYCQNTHISKENFGQEISVSRLAQIMLELQEQGAHNINLVTALHFAPQVKEALILAKKAGLTLPIVCNTSGYEKEETLAALANLIDIWLVDVKYHSESLAKELSFASNYPQVAMRALAFMYRQNSQAGGRIFNQEGMMQKGIIMRHLVLPQHTQDSKHVLTNVFDMCGNDIDYSVMNQYTPNAYCKRQGGPLARSLTRVEYEEVLDFADDLGIEHLWWQEEGTDSQSFIPPFDTTGVAGPELHT